jgi:hypothetical protein
MLETDAAWEISTWLTSPRLIALGKEEGVGIGSWKPPHCLYFIKTPFS